MSPLESDNTTRLGADDFVEVRFKNIYLSYHLKNSLMDLVRMLDSIRGFMEDLSEDLGVVWGILEIQIARTKAEWVDLHTKIEEDDLKSWIQGDSGRAVRVILDEEKIQSYQALEIMVLHECVHHAVHRLAGDSVPAWLDEGLAVYLSQDLTQAYQETLDSAAQAGAFLPLDMLEAPFTRMDRRLKTLAYAQAHSFIKYIVTSHGWKVIVEMLAAFQRGDSLDASLRQFGLNFYLLESYWEQHCTRGR